LTIDIIIPINISLSKREIVNIRQYSFIIILLGSISTIKAADRLCDEVTTINLSYMAIQVSNNPRLLSVLSDITGDFGIINLRGNSKLILSVLATLTNVECSQMMGSIRRAFPNDSARPQRYPAASSSSPSIVPVQNTRASSFATKFSDRMPIQRILEKRASFNISNNRSAAAQFEVAPLGDCGLLSLNVDLPRNDAKSRIEQALRENKFSKADVRYL
jgi:hypothetical protein